MVSNTNVRQATLFLWSVLLGLSLWALSSPAKKTDKAAIDLVKNALVDSFDHSLPKVSLEFFLKYESEAAPIRWELHDCREQAGNDKADPGRDYPVCVEADIELKNDRSVVVLMSVGTVANGLSGVPSFFGATIIESGGLTRSLRRLGDLPRELHRPVPKGPRDLPLPVAKEI